MERIPDEVGLKILSFLNLEDRARLFCVCRKWKNLLEESWRRQKCGRFVGALGPNLRSVLKRSWIHLESAEFYRIELNSFDLGKELAENTRLKSLTIRESYVSAENVNSFGKFLESGTVENFVWDSNEIRPPKIKEKLERKMGNAGISPEFFPHGENFSFPDTKDSILRDFLSSKIKNLKSLHVEGVPLHGHTFIALCTNCGPKLEQLCVKGDCFLKEGHLREGLGHLKCLKELNVNGKCRKNRQVVNLLSDNSLEWICQNLESLEKLSMENAQQFSQVGLTALFTKETLKFLSICGCQNFTKQDVRQALLSRYPKVPVFEENLHILAYGTQLKDTVIDDALKIQVFTEFTRRKVAVTNGTIFGEKIENLVFLLSSSSSDAESDS